MKPETVSSLEPSLECIQTNHVIKIYLQQLP